MEWNILDTTHYADFFLTFQQDNWSPEDPNIP